MKDVELDRSTGYFSKSMQDRRRRIILETIQMINEGGIGNLSLSEVCRRANVARRTIYYAFETRDSLIAAAIEEQTDRLEQGILYEHEVGSLARVIERICHAAKRNIDLPNYAQALISMYFATDTGAEIWTKLHTNPALIHRAWVEKLHAHRQLQPWADPAELSGDITQLRYAVAHRWLRGDIPSADFAKRLVLAVLMYVSGAARGAARREIDEVIQRIATEGPHAYLEKLRRAKGHSL